MLIRSLLAIFASLALTAVVIAGDNLKAFPPAAKGQVRHVLDLPADEQESLLRVELIVGKTVAVDAQNRYFFGGKLESKTAAGWGYSYYLLPKLGPLAGTRMAVDPDAPKTNRFIALGGEPLLLRYNSKLPIVVYVPEGVEVRYRIWRAPAESTPVKEG